MKNVLGLVCFGLGIVCGIIGEIIAIAFLIWTIVLMAQGTIEISFWSILGAVALWFGRGIVIFLIAGVLFVLGLVLID